LPVVAVLYNKLPENIMSVEVAFVSTFLPPPVAADADNSAFASADEPDAAAVGGNPPM
jgi:hypothetical protein